MSFLHKLARFVVVLFLSVQIASAAADFKTIDVPGALATNVNGINSQGDMTGPYLDSSTVTWQGFLDSGGVITKFAFPGSNSTTPWGINDSKQIVGYYRDTTAFHDHGFLFDGTNFTGLDYPGATATYALGINNAGEITGYYLQGGSGAHGFVLNNGTYTTLDPPGKLFGTQLYAINNFGGIVGLTSGAAVFGVRYGGGVFKPIKFRGSPTTAAFGLNDNGVVVGQYSSGSHTRCFTFIKGQFHTLTFPATEEMSCQGVNNSGQIVGWRVDSSDQTHGFVISF
jgi:hypothetical protein